MKKLYFSFALSALSLFASAQCTVNSTVFSGPLDYGIIPDTITNLPLAYVGTPYVTDIQLHFQQDTTTGLGTFPFTDFVIDSIVGIPQGFSYLPNPANGTFPGGSYGCVGLTGTATQGQETGGPQGNGVYPIIIYFTANVNIFNVITPFPSTWTGYRLEIEPASNVQTMNNYSFEVMQNAPNPADRSTELLFTSPSNNNVQFTLYNVLGETVQHSSFQATRGENRLTINTSYLPAGVYMYSLRMGNAVITKRMTISH